MKNLTTVCFLVAALLMSAVPVGATPPVFHGSVTVPVGGSIDASNAPIAQLSGGLLPSALSIPTSATIVFFGDSITVGYQSSTCQSSNNGTNNYKTPVSNPTGTCFADRFAHYFGATAVNAGWSGSTLQNCVNTGTCPSSASSGINRYTTDVIPYASASNYLVILYGINDVRDGPPNGNNKNTFSAATYKANLTTIVQAAITAGFPADHIIICGLTYVNPQTFGVGSVTQSSYLFPYEMAYTAAAAQVAIANHTRFASTFDYMANNGGLSILADGLHPNDTGYGILANAVEGNSYLDAAWAEGAYNILSAITQGANNFTTWSGLLTSNWNANTLGASPPSTTTPQYAVAVNKGNVGDVNFYNTDTNATGTVFDWRWESSSSAETQVGSFDKNGNFYVYNNANTNGLNANRLNTLNTNSGAPNPAVALYSSGGNVYGSEVYNDGSNNSTAILSPNNGPVVSFLTYTAGSYPAAQSSFSRVGYVSSGGNLVMSGLLQGLELKIAGPQSNADSAVNANATNIANTNAQAPNPTIDVYNAGGTANHFGMTLYHDGTAFSLGQYTPTGMSGFSWLTYTASSFPTLQSGFTRIAQLNPSGSLWVLGTLGWGGSSGPTLTSGSGAPSGACTAGAIYTRTDSSAAAGSEMYVCRNVSGTGTWEAVSGG